ncbi:AMP-binding protein [Nocardia sp. NPDC049707]|uniref:AMP-binding protein n=1 Tax=Nocardia sp. NPDC049707 TaxID=3154735 RepID=UPI00341A1FFE
MDSSPIVRCGTESRTHAEVKARAARLAGGLAAMGLSHGDRFSIVMRNGIGFIEGMLAGAILGATPVPVNWHWTGGDLEYLLADSGSQIAVVHTDLLPAVEAVLPTGSSIIEAPVPHDTARAFGFDAPMLTGRYPDMEELIVGNTAATSSLEAPPMGIIYTSGTTGRPKGILRDTVSPDNRRRLGEIVLRGLALEPSMPSLIPAPLYHTAPNLHAVFALELGVDLEIMPRFDAEAMLQLIERRRIAHMQVVPTMLVRLLKLPSETRNRYDVSSLKAIFHAAAPCPKPVKRAAIEWFGPIVHEYYGGSEVGAAVSCTSEEWLAHPGTVGHPIDDAVIKILDIDGTEMPTGEDGDIYIKSYSVWPDFTYLGDDTKRRHMERDGFLTVGDIGHLDGDGYLYLSDRRSDMVISGGVNIYPAEIEACVLEIDGVNDVAVFGIPDPEYGESLAAHIELAPNASVDVENIRSHIASNLARYKVPKVIVFDNSLPRHESGKLFKRILKQEYWTTVQSDS